MKKTQHLIMKVLLPCVMIGIVALVVANLWAQEHRHDQGREPAGQWQYLALTHDISPEAPQQDLGRQILKLGREQWELVSVANVTKAGTTTKTVFYFKKPL